MKEIGEIRQAINTFRSDTTFLKLRSRWDEDFDLYRLKPYNAGKGYFSYTSNYPRVYINKLTAMLTGAKLIIRVPEEVLTKELRDKANNAERFWYGCFNLNDEKSMLTPDNFPILGQKAWYSCVRGGFATRTYVYKDEDGQTIPEIKVWDIYNIAYDSAPKGTGWTGYTYQANREQLEKIYKIKIPGGFNRTVDVIDFSDEKQFGVIAGNEWLKPLEEHGLDHNPVHIFKTGDMPITWTENYTDTYAHVGEGSLAAIRSLMPMFNKTMSDYLTLVRRGVKAPLVSITANGESPIDEDIWQVEKAATVALRTGESITPLVPQTMPPDAATIVNLISGELQRGGLPHTAFGELGFRLSGYAINQLQGSLETILQPHVECITRSYKVECDELIKQFSEGSFKSIAIRGRTSKNQPFGYPTDLELKSSDVEGDWHPEVTLSATLPKDDAQNIEMARLATQSEKPLMSMRTARSIYLGLDDVDMEEEQLSLDWSDNLNFNRLYRAYMRAVEDGQPEIAMNILAELKRLKMEQQPKGQAQPGAPMPSATEAMGLPGAGGPVGATGVSPQVMPAEAMGGFPPGAMNSTMR